MRSEQITGPIICLKGEMSAAPISRGDGALAESSWMDTLVFVRRQMGLLYHTSVPRSCSATDTSIKLDAEKLIMDSNNNNNTRC